MTSNNSTFLYFLSSTCAFLAKKPIFFSLPSGFLKKHMESWHPLLNSCLMTGPHGTLVDTVKYEKPLKKDQQVWHCFPKKIQLILDRIDHMTIYYMLKIRTHQAGFTHTVWNVQCGIYNMRIQLYSNQTLLIVPMHLCKQLFGASFAMIKARFSNICFKFFVLGIFQHAWKSYKIPGQLLLHASFS